MGTFTIIIEGTGPHHSATGQTANDANQDHANLVDTLRAHGCSIQSSIFRFGGAHAFSDENVVDTAGARTQWAANAAALVPAQPINTTPVSPGSTAEPMSIDGGLAGGTP